MNDALAGLVVAAITAVLVAGIFMLTGMAKKKRIGALRSLCAQRGWKYHYDGGSLHQGHAVEGDGWVFEAVSRSSGREAAPGSSDWDHSSRWIARGEDPGRSTFILGSRLAADARGDLAAMPLPIQARWSRYLGEEAVGLQAYPPGERLEGRFVLLAREKPPPRGLWGALTEQLLLAWPGKFPLVVRSSPARLSLQVTGKRLEKPEDVLRLIELGESFRGG